MASTMAQIPIDRTRREHVGKVERVLWSDRDQPCSIIKLTDEKIIVVNELPEKFDRGTLYRFMGRWIEGKRGPQFKVDTFTADQPAHKLGVIKYLTETCEGIGQKLAERLWDAYGPDAIKTLRENPQQVTADGLLGEQSAISASDDLRRFVACERTKTDLFSLFAGRGFPGKLIESAISLWGAKAPDVIRGCPFRLLTNHLPGCGWKRCDKLHLDLGKNRESLKRSTLAGWNALREDRTGSTWLPAQAVYDAIKDAVPKLEEPTRAIKLGLRAGVFRIHRDGAERWIAIGEHARDEQRVCDAVKRLQRGTILWPVDRLKASESPDDGLPSLHQVEKLRRAMSSPIGCLIGGPGTGKSYSVAEMLKLLGPVVGFRNIAVAAPTGIAAKRITEYMKGRDVNLRATTIHRLLGIGRNGHDGRGWGFVHNRGNPLEHKVVIVDEASMIDASLMACLLDAVDDYANILLIGDPFQLAPVNHGAPLRDMLAAGIAQGELTETRRNAGLIVRGCAAIKAGERPEIAERFDLDAADPVNLRFVDAKGKDALEFVEKVLSTMTRFDPVWGTQIITATNEKSDLSRKAVNERFAKLLNPNGRRADGIPFSVGDKVICTRNSKLRTAQYDIGMYGLSVEASEIADNYLPQTDELDVRNGDIGRVQAVSAKGMVLDIAGGAIWVPKSKPKPKDDTAGDGNGESTGGAMGDFEHAYAITGHKSQGSQWPCVIVLADPAGASVADRNWWYTVLSRAEKACLVVGDRAAFENQSRRVTMTKRKTLLTEMLAVKADGIPPAPIEVKS
jgi:exodeoxyribonuclease V alpha subunit